MSKWQRSRWKRKNPNSDVSDTVVLDRRMMVVKVLKGQKASFVLSAGKWDIFVNQTHATAVRGDYATKALLQPDDGVIKPGIYIAELPIQYRDAVTTGENNG